jgi:hypothetical protein
MNRGFALLAVSFMAAALPMQARAQSVTLRFQIIEADGFTETDSAIADVREALRELFRFRGYRLATETLIRVDDGHFSQNFPTAGEVQYSITAKHVMLANDSAGAKNVNIRDLGLWAGSDDQILTTSLTVPVGQTVVVGATRMRKTDAPVLILVVRPDLR